MVRKDSWQTFKFAFVRIMVQIQIYLQSFYPGGWLKIRLDNTTEWVSTSSLQLKPTRRVHNFIKHGPHSIRSSMDMFNWIVSIDKSVAQLTQFGEGETQIKRSVTLPSRTLPLCQS
jgi:hypothetical protein